jgi:hypothetical protein
MVMRILLLCILSGIFWCGATASVSAQVETSFVGNTLNITLSPQYPSPEEVVTATLDDYTLDTSGATIIWTIDGVDDTTLTNQRSIRLRAPAIGEQATIGVRLVFASKPSIAAKTTITPVYVDIIVEPQTYTPLFYAGRALPVNGGVINITALLHTKTGMADPQQYTYNWQHEGKSVYGGPRAGNNRARISVPFNQNSLVALTITDARGVIISRKLVSIPVAEVDVRFYEVNTLYGLSQKAIGDSLTFVGNNSTIRAVPYYIDNRIVNGSLFAEWKIDGRTPESTGSDPFEINLMRQGSGNVSVGFKVRNLNELLQGDSESFRVQF